MKVIITRFEDFMVVCEDANGKEYVIEQSKIPSEATEGNVLKKTLTGKYQMDEDEELLRMHRMQKMTERKKKPIEEPSVES